jgi:two-component system chemotaxis sensor kinase CheA
MEDDILKDFIDESFEHLADIEGDLLAIEQNGADIDLDLVNKVYRAAHSIKGGAGFMDLEVIKELTHEMENILGKIRSCELVPGSEIVGALLSAADTLKALLSDIGNSNKADISRHLGELRAITDDKSSVSAKPHKEATVIHVTPAETAAAQPLREQDVIALARRTGKNVYQINIDIVKDIELKQMSLSHFIEEALSTGDILKSSIEVTAAPKGLRNGEKRTDSLILHIVYATILDPGDVNMVFNLDDSQIVFLPEDRDVGSPGGDFNAPPNLVAAYAEPTVADNASEPAIPSDLVIPEEEPAVIPQSAGETTLPPGKLEKPDRPTSGPATPTGGENTVRVQVNMLEKLMNLAGELVLSRNQLLQSISSHDSRLIEMGGQRMDRITSSLQEAIMLTRMQPVGIVFNKFPRVVRDLSQKLGKEVELLIEGKEVELDKTIIEAINDPLTHLIRNSVDHGIELPAERAKAGKPPGGRIELRAFHAAGQVNIEVRDDGRGLYPDKLVASAISKGIITEQQARLMSENEKMNLIFLPGFSTAQKVSDVSGRGVGMDVVKTNIEKIGGHVLIDSQPGIGTNIQIRLPLTLAIIPCQIVVVMEERFAIPQVNLLELIRITPDKLKERIEIIGNSEVLRLRDELLPLVRLADVIGIERKYLDPACRETTGDRRTMIADRRSRRLAGDDFEECEGESPTGESPSRVKAGRQASERRYHAGSSLNIAVVTSATMKYGLIVDRLLDAEEIVVKPLSRHLKGYKGYAGATIMGDGRVSLILDVTGLAQMAQLNFVARSERTGEEAMARARSQGDIQSLLLFHSAPGEQFAVPLGLVQRIEKIKNTQIETIGGRRVMQYKGESLPLFSLDEAAKVAPIPDIADLIVIVFFISGREIGLLATAPIDAVELRVAFDDLIMKQTGIMGSAIIADHTTLLADIYGLMQAIVPDWFSGRKGDNPPDLKKTTILYAEDSRFFRTQVKSFMEEEGFLVIEAEDGEAAWNLLKERHEEITLVVTDIEMPNLDGYGLAQKIKSSAEFSHFPVIALTTLAGEDNQAKGRALGIDEYNIKLDRENLLASIQRQLKRVR